MEINIATSSIAVDSVQKMLNKFGNVRDPRATITMMLKNRRIDDSRFDYKPYTIEMTYGQTFNKGAYIGFEEIDIHSITLQPYTEIVIVNQNRFHRKTILRNGTEAPQQHNFTFIKPRSMSIYCQSTDATEKFQVDDGSLWLDLRLWGIICAFLLLILVIVTFTAIIVEEVRLSSGNGGGHRYRLF